MIDEKRYNSHPSFVIRHSSHYSEFALVNAITSSTVAKANPVTVSAQP